MKSQLLVFFFSLALTLPAQDYATIGFKGKVHTGPDKGDSVEVVLFEENRKMSSYETRKNGKFILDLDRNKYYVVQFSKENYVTKRIVIDTRIDGKGYPKKKFKFDVNLIPENEDLDYSALDFPIAIIEYNRNNDVFDYDFEYTRARAKEEQELVERDPYLAMN